MESQKKGDVKETSERLLDESKKQKEPPPPKNKGFSIILQVPGHANGARQFGFDLSWLVMVSNLVLLGHPRRQWWKEEKVV
jgi:hypothetical protein